jgi:hypothetical protein
MMTTTAVWFERTLDHVSPYAPERHSHRVNVLGTFPGRHPMIESAQRLEIAWEVVPKDGPLEQLAETLLLRAGALAVRIETEDGAVEARR